MAYSQQAICAAGSRWLYGQYQKAGRPPPQWMLTWLPRMKLFPCCREPQSADLRLGPKRKIEIEGPPVEVGGPFLPVERGLLVNLEIVGDAEGQDRVHLQRIKIALVLRNLTVQISLR